MAKQPIQTDKNLPPIGPFAQGVRTGNLIFVSGSVGRNLSGKMAGDGGITAQTRQTLENIKAVLAEASATLDNVVKVTVFLTDVNDYAAMNEVRAEYFPDPGNRPASSSFIVAGLVSPEYKVEIEAVAALD